MWQQQQAQGPPHLGAAPADIPRSGGAESDDEAAGSAPPQRPKTIMTSEAEVANGFVKNGTSLPYIFETNESGNRKRSSKILPVCGMCGKKFVCVTTMKRHLVTHTGEKPFSCKVCGKQYTQKGNLRVHERTHRNDRPFECNICHQKFYRKEPMQKHQWRQHGIVHFKSRPNNGGCAPSTNGPSPAGGGTSGGGVGGGGGGPPLGIIGAEGVLYNSLIERIKNGNNGGIAQNDAARYESPAAPASIQGGGPPYEERAAEGPGARKSAPSSREQARTPNTTTTTTSSSTTDVGQFSDDSSNHSVSQAVARYLNHGEDEEEEEEEEEEGEEVGEEEEHEADEVLNAPSSRVAEAEAKALEEKPEEAVSSRPIKLKMKLTQAYMKEIKENREREERYNRGREGRDTSVGGHVAGEGQDCSAIRSLDSTLSDIRLSASNNEHQNDDHQHGQQPGRQPSLGAPPPAPLASASGAVSGRADREEAGQQHQQAAAGSVENVECQCKSCGTRCHVTDPYNFRCPACNVRYTSLPTHLIADPLQCIGCLEVFPHKPAMKSHQGSSDKERPFRCCKCGYEFRQKAHLQKHQWRIHRRRLEPDPGLKEAEAILHAVNEMSGGGSGGNSGGPAPGNNNSSNNNNNNNNAAVVVGTAKQVDQIGTSAVLTIQDIIDRGVEHQIQKEAAPPPPSHPPQPTNAAAATTRTRHQSFDGSKPLDLSPSKMYGTAGSITKWVQQVETARTPIIPDISIHKKPILAAATAEAGGDVPSPAPALEPPPPSAVLVAGAPPAPGDLPQFKMIQPAVAPLSGGGGRISSDPAALTIRLLQPKGVSWPTSPLPQHYAVKSRPAAEQPSPPDAGAVGPRWRSNARADNPLLNQVNHSQWQHHQDDQPTDTMQQQQQQAAIDRSSKRPRTDGAASAPVSGQHQLPPIAALQKPATHVHHQQHHPRHHQHHHPRHHQHQHHHQQQHHHQLPQQPADLSTRQHQRQAATASPPLNLSAEARHGKLRDHHQESMTGQLKRLKHLDDRSGI